MVKVRWKLCQSKNFSQILEETKRLWGGRLISVMFCLSWRFIYFTKPKKCTKIKNIHKKWWPNILVPLPSQHTHPALPDNSLSFYWQTSRKMKTGPGIFENEACGDRETSAAGVYGQCSTWLIQLSPSVTNGLTMRSDERHMPFSHLTPNTRPPSVNTRKGTQRQNKSQRVNVAFSFLPRMLSIINGVCVANCAASIHFTWRCP